MWERFCEWLSDWPDRLGPTAFALRDKTAHAYYARPSRPGDVAIVGLFDDLPAWIEARDAVKAAGLSVDAMLLAGPEDPWIKVAGSPTLRAIGENLNFIPGKYFFGVPNQASPLAASLTSGMLLGGAGWLGGHALKRILPERFGERLPTSLAVLGAGLGGAAGLGYAGLNSLAGSDHPLTDNRLFDPRSRSPMGPGPKPPPVEQLPMPAPPAMERLPYPKEKTAVFAALDVNVNALGQTLWQLGASDPLAAATMGAVYAAQQMPDDRASPGVVTANQLGQLAANMAGDYLTGVAVGAILNHVVGTPYTAPQFGGANAALGLVRTVVPKLFGS